MNDKSTNAGPSSEAVLDSDETHLVQVALSKDNYTLGQKAAEIWGRDLVKIVLTGAMDYDYRDYDYRDALPSVLWYGIKEGWAEFDTYPAARSLAEKFKAALPSREVVIAPFPGGYAVSFVGGICRGEKMIDVEHSYGPVAVPEMSEIL